LPIGSSETFTTAASNHAKRIIQCWFPNDLGS
jgi:hypothetical protein